ncbi:DNA repair protein RecN [Streptacidiphilus sp. EB129]|uniref:DNA repair protein RecN n=1 Tax=Streptacidiphilus sp. EB129 TaxID=3156262 RepID=UPI0035153E8F
MRIRALGVIEDAVVELSPGFTVVTGETGAGKTMVVTSLGLLCGGRADPGLVRNGAERAVVEGRVALAADSPAALRAIEAGAELDEGTLLISRTVSAEGRSRAHVGGRSVPVSLLATLGEDLIAVHGQTDQQRLLQPARQRGALDRYAGDTVSVPLGEYQTAYRRLREVSALLDELTTRARERAQEADLLRFGLDEVAAAEPLADEDVQLAAESERLGHADALSSAATQAHAALAGEPSEPDAVDAGTLLAQSRRALESVRGHDPRLAALADRLGEVGYLLSDIAQDLAGYADDLDADPARLAAVEERRAVLAHLVRKYANSAAGAAGSADGGLAQVLAWAETASVRLLELDGDDDRISALESEQESLTEAVSALAAQLTAARYDAAEKFAEAVTAELTELAMPHARVSFGITATPEFGPYGADEVEVLLAPHPGAPPRPIAKGASGGELSRVMLAVEVVFAGVDPVPTYLFDEVDAGVGGKAAVEVGRRLARLARTSQVVVVTHLPQVAAFADRHLVVEKTVDGTVTRSGVTTLNDAERVRELSRMLAGLEDSELGRAHAEELLAAARTHGVPPNG